MTRRWVTVVAGVGGLVAGQPVVLGCTRAGLCAISVDTYVAVAWLLERVERNLDQPALPMGHVPKALPVGKLPRLRTRQVGREWRAEDGERQLRFLPGGEVLEGRVGRGGAPRRWTGLPLAQAVRT